MTTPIKYDVTVGVEEAKRALADFEAALKKSDNAALKLDTDIARLEVQQAELSAAIKAGGANARAYAVELQRVTEQLGRMRGQAQSASAAVASVHVPTRNVGMAFLDLSRAVEDAQYGLGGVVNNIPSLVMALGGGAGLTGAISLGAVAINQLVKNLTAVDPAAEEAAKAAEKSAESIRSAYAEATDEVARLSLGIDGLARKKAQESIDQARSGGSTALAALGGEEAFRQTLKDWGPNGARSLKVQDALTYTFDKMGATAGKRSGQRITEEMFDAAMKAIEQIDQAVGTQTAQAQARGLRGLAEADKEEDALSKLRASRASKQAAKEDPSGNYRALYEAGRRSLGILSDEEIEKEAARMEKTMRDEAQKMAEGALAGREFADEVKLQAIDREIEANYAKYKALQDLDEKYYKGLGDLVEKAGGNLLSASSDYLQAKIKGEEDAEAKAVANFLSSTGDMLVGSGTKSIFEGAIASANPLTAAAGPGMIATGIAAVAAGVAMGAGSAALTGATGKGSAASGGRDPGAAPRRTSGGTGGDGSLTININNALSLPEDIARAINSTLKTGDRRRGGR